ncbi:MAG: hypothetical protein LBK66_11835 [Spirochaetaceae bacterium]|jgi:DNA-binding transcriptional regulator YiaG|nr:hypothetical protein [Spirochaetaceae bacterium]
MENYRDEMAMVIHEDALALYKAGALTEEETREFDRECFVEEPEPFPYPARRVSNRQLASYTVKTGAITAN